MKQAQKKRILYLHIGIPKTATTWLQSRVFSQLDHIKYLDCPRSELFKATNKEEISTRFLGEVFQKSSRIWSEYGDIIFEDLVGDRHKWLEHNKDLLISEEGIGRSGSRPALLAAHLRELKLKASGWGFHHFKIIYIIRRQDHWLASHYAQMSDRISKPEQTDFERLIREIASPRESRFGFGMLLDHNVLYDHLVDVVGKDSLLILPYEMLEESPEGFLNLLLQKLNTPSNKIKEIYEMESESKANVRSGQEQLTWRLRRKISRLRRLPLVRWIINNKKAKTIRLTSEISQKINDTYSEGNQALAEKTNLDLCRYGYINQKNM